MVSGPSRERLVYLSLRKSIFPTGLGCLLVIISRLVFGALRGRSLLTIAPCWSSLRSIGNLGVRAAVRHIRRLTHCHSSHDVVYLRPNSRNDWRKVQIGCQVCAIANPTGLNIVDVGPKGTRADLGKIAVLDFSRFFHEIDETGSMRLDLMPNAGSPHHGPS